MDSAPPGYIFIELPTSSHGQEEQYSTDYSYVPYETAYDPGYPMSNEALSEEPSENFEEESYSRKESVQSKRERMRRAMASKKRTDEESKARKAAMARNRYHRMNDEQKKAYNRRRIDNMRKRKAEATAILEKPIGEVAPEDLEKARAYLESKDKRSRQAMSRYQRMTPDQRREYNKKRNLYYQRKKEERMANDEKASASQTPTSSKSSQKSSTSFKNEPEEIDVVSTTSTPATRRSTRSQAKK